ncbi:MAG: plasmid pRiA4b ORF-3 family protein [Chloroflexi bacterium]|nr:plasmid pRiA4b ORF-3 family protein [Chloroflexota bacterium]
MARAGLAFNIRSAVYQLRIVLRGISPLIWRRLLVRSDSTVADLHRTLQVAFGWSDEHLHRFVIQRRLYGDDSLVDSRRVQLASLGLHLRERFA